MRTNTGEGQQIAIYVLDRATTGVDPFIADYGETAICGSVGEDYAACGWPITVKVKFSVPRETLVQHLRDLADAIEDEFFYIGPPTGDATLSVDGDEF